MKQKLLFLILIILFPLFASPIHAQVAVEASVDKPTLSLDDTLVLTLRVKGASNFGEPRIPNRGNFNVVSRGSSSNIEMINGRLSSSREYLYVLAPQKVGVHSIGPMTVSVEGVEYSAGPITVTVVESEPSPNPSARGQQPQQNNPLQQMPSWTPFPGWSPPYTGQAAPPPPSNNNDENARDVFVTAEVSNPNPYKGEQVLYTFRLYTSLNVGTAKLELPDFQDFISDEVQKENKYYKEMNGKRYVVSEYRISLFPTQAGTFTIPPALLRAEVEEAMPQNPFNSPFFNFQMRGMNSRPRMFRTNPVALNVKSLPPNAPADFSGLVGNFTLEANLSKKDLSVGETATLTLNISGTGNIKEASLSPNLQIPNLKVYADKPSLEVKKGPAGISGVKSFKYALVPEGSGKIEIPSVTLSYFDPKAQDYVSLSSPGYEITVAPGVGQEKNKLAISPESLGKTPSLMNPMGEDVSSIHPQLRLQSGALSVQFLYVLLALFVLPPLIFLVSYLAWRRLNWEKSNISFLRKKKAYPKALGDLKKINLRKSSDLPEKMSHILKEYLGDKLGCVGTALTPMEAEKIFLQKNKKSKTGPAFGQFLQDLDAWVYAGPPTEKDWEIKARKKAMALLKDAEKIL